MFLEIKIRKSDQNAQRFLWRSKNRQIEPEEYEVTSLLFGSKSSPSTALYVKNKNADEFKSKYPAAAKSIVENSYMDDFLDSCATQKEAKNRISQVIEINAAADWEMHGWACNVQSVLKSVQRNEKSNKRIN